MVLVRSLLAFTVVSASLWHLCQSEYIQGRIKTLGVRSLTFMEADPGVGGSDTSPHFPLTKSSDWQTPVHSSHKNTQKIHTHVQQNPTKRITFGPSFV